MPQGPLDAFKKEDTSAGDQDLFSLNVNMSYSEL